MRQGTKGLAFNEPLIFERSKPGREAFSLPEPDVPVVDPAELLGDRVRGEIDGFPEVSENDVVRHFFRLSTWNYGIDHGMYPLGSCTMKYNPKVNEAVARFPGFTALHPLAPDSLAQGALELMWRLGEALKEITGMAGVSLQPSAGAQGEFTGLRMIRACLEARGDARQSVIIPDSAHGTNPASAVLNGYEVRPLASDARGCLDPAALREAMDESVAAIMLTNPNTLGIFERKIEEVCRIVHERGGLVYMDGANLNALMGKSRPGEFGVDVMHLNLHKTFSTPHGGGGPGSGPVTCTAELEPFLPRPVVVREGEAYRLEHDRPQSIGRVRSFNGNFGINVRAFCYILAMGPGGLERSTELAVLNANYIRARLAPHFHLEYDAPSLHEVIFDDKLLKETGVTTLDIAKRLMDYGFHPMTVYFPLIVHGAMMIEPTENESRESLDAFCDAMIAIAEEARTDPEIVKTAPHSTRIRRLDEVAANRKPILRWTPERE
ncbi:MAG TPA: aminomethyl-transferring glycine dehydrogenase subunit GcvPB [Acidobacteriota bacterium]|nr:aminomethyl-transferring glycine dehydrogenase subunit GcvPB [Acidobacteriota bacterium]